MQVLSKFTTVEFSIRGVFQIEKSTIILPLDNVCRTIANLKDALGFDWKSSQKMAIMAVFQFIKIL